MNIYIILYSDVLRQWRRFMVLDAPTQNSFPTSSWLQSQASCTWIEVILVCSLCDVALKENLLNPDLKRRLGHWSAVRFVQPPPLRKDFEKLRGKSVHYNSLYVQLYMYEYGFSYRNAIRNNAGHLLTYHFQLYQYPPGHTVISDSGDFLRVSQKELFRCSIS